MKLVYVANVGIPIDWAHSIQVMKMCEAFSLSGFDVELVVPKRYTGMYDDPYVYYGVKRNFRITKIACVDIGKGSSSPIIYRLRLFSFLISARIFLFGKQVDALYTREPFASLFFNSSILELHDIPKVIKNVHRRMWARASKLVVLTRFIKERLVALGVPAQKIMVAPDGVPLETFDIAVTKKEAREKLGLPKDKSIIMYTGSNVAWKGLAVIKNVSQYLPMDCLTIFVGDIKGVNSDKEFFPGFQPYGKIPLWLKAADVLVLTGNPDSLISKYYTSPLKMFEYMASGRPIVASDLPSFREVLGERNCLLAKPDDPSAFGGAIVTLLGDTKLASKLGRQALSDVGAYTWTNRAKTIQAFINATGRVV